MWVDDQYGYAPTDPGPPRRSGARKWWIIGGAVLAVVALVAGGTVVATKSLRDTAAPSTVIDLAAYEQAAKNRNTLL